MKVPSSGWKIEFCDIQDFEDVKLVKLIGKYNLVWRRVSTSKIANYELGSMEE